MYFEKQRFVNCSVLDSVMQQMLSFQKRHSFLLTLVFFVLHLQAQNDSSCVHISCFPSICPAVQDDLFHLPGSHAFQLLLKQGATYTSGGIVPGLFDFTGYVPVDGSSEAGIISLNHETVPAGAVSMLHVQYNQAQRLWNISESAPVDFTPVVRTLRNCSGTVTPWGTVILGEEVRTVVDTNSDGYQDVGWLVEMNPLTHQVETYGTGTAQKLWAMGRMAHENLVVSPGDMRTVYFGEDFPTGALYKFIADTPGNLSQGHLFTLKLDVMLSSGMPQTPYGRWIELDNSTQQARNFMYDSAAANGATPFNGIEDVEINPLDGRIYFASKGHGRIYRFTDQDSTVSGFEVFAGGRNYDIVCENGTVSEPWDIGNDNLAFDDLGNLWVLQDGGKSFIWMIHADHTQINPKVEIFGRSPNGSEPTGITFSPDKRFLFMSIQHPSNTVSSQIDASGNEVAINASSMLVIGRKEFLGSIPLPLPAPLPFAEITAFPNPSNGRINIHWRTTSKTPHLLELFDNSGRLLERRTIIGTNEIQQLQLENQPNSGLLLLRISNEKGFILKKLISQ
jgi:secreted PhoX family phosphatase